MTSHERAQLFLLLRAYVAGQLHQSQTRFADRRTLQLIEACLWLFYRNETDQGYEDDEADDDDVDDDEAAFQRWLLTLWPTPPAA